MLELAAPYLRNDVKVKSQDSPRDGAASRARQKKAINTQLNAF